jgi:hypothetical protein
MVGSEVAATCFKRHLQHLAGESDERHILRFLWLDSGLGIEPERFECKGQTLECDTSCKELLIDSRGLFERAEYPAWFITGNNKYYFIVDILWDISLCQSFWNK